MLIFSFDPGTKNMGVCVVFQKKIIDWTVWLTDGSTKDVINSLHAYVTYILDMIPKDSVIEEVRVVIERQPPINKKSTKIQTMLECFFFMCTCFNSKVELRSSCLKWKKLNVPMPKTYSERKKKAVEKCASLLDSFDEWKQFFLENNKKDDLADSFLQIIDFIF